MQCPAKSPLLHTMIIHPLVALHFLYSVKPTGFTNPKLWRLKKKRPVLLQKGSLLWDALAPRTARAQAHHNWGTSICVPCRCCGDNQFFRTCIMPHAPTLWLTKLHKQNVGYSLSLSLSLSFFLARLLFLIFSCHCYFFQNNFRLNKATENNVMRV